MFGLLGPNATAAGATRAVALLAATALHFIAAPAGAANPGAIFSAQQATPDGADADGAARVDPIVSPGPRGTLSAHPHIFCGAQGVASNSTAGSLLAGGTTFVEKGIHSALWEPQAKYDGVPLMMGTTSSGGGKHALVYYREISGSAQPAQPLPFGLKMVLKVGTLHGVSVNLGDELIFKCGPGSSTDLPAPPSQCSSNVLSTSARFPQCWDGQNLDTITPFGTAAVNPNTGQVYPNDHLSHMRYPSGGTCPSSHPVKTWRVEQFFRHWVPGYANGLDPQKFTFGGQHYSTFHTDYMFAWNPVSAADFQNRCIDANVDCGTDPNLAE